MAEGVRAVNAGGAQEVVGGGGHLFRSRLGAMALGLLGIASGRTLQIRLAENVGALGLAAPTLITDGFNLLSGAAVFKRFIFADRGAIMISKVSGTGVSIASARLFGYYGEHVEGDGPASWGAMGPGTNADRGKLNLAGVIGEVETTKILLLEDVDGLLAIERIAVGLGVISGTLPVVNVDLILTRRVH